MTIAFTITWRRFLIGLLVATVLVAGLGLVAGRAVVAARPPRFAKFTAQRAIDEFNAKGLQTGTAQADALAAFFGPRVPAYRDSRQFGLTTGMVFVMSFDNQADLAGMYEFFRTYSNTFLPMRLLIHENLLLATLTTRDRDPTLALRYEAVLLALR